MSKHKHIFIVKSFEDLTVKEFEHTSENLRTGEPLNFVKEIFREANDTHVYLFNNECLTDKPSKLSNGNTICEWSTDKLTWIPPDTEDVEIVLLLWQGLRGFKEFKLRESYSNYQWLQRFFNNTYKIAPVREYFVMTDLRCPMFDIGIPIDTTNMTILSQAKIDYRKDMQQIFDEQTSAAVKTMYGTKIYTKFKDFKYFELHTLVADQMMLSAHTLTDLSFVSQGYAAMTGIRRRTFLALVTDKALNAQFDIDVIGNLDEASLHQMNIDSGGAEIESNLTGFVPWHTLKNEMSRSSGSICVNNEAYDKYELIPNRVVESICAGSVPIFMHCNVMKVLGPTFDELNMKVQHKFRKPVTFGKLDKFTEAIRQRPMRLDYILELRTWLSGEVESFRKKLRTL